MCKIIALSRLSVSYPIALPPASNALALAVSSISRALPEIVVTPVQSGFVAQRSGEIYIFSYSSSQTDYGQAAYIEQVAVAAFKKNRRGVIA